MKYLSLIFAVVLLQFTHCIAYADELSIRDSIRKQVRIAFLNEDFGKLEELVHSYRTKDRRTPSGAQKINLFDDGLKLAMAVPPEEGEKYSVKMEEKARRWIDAYPKSPVAHLAYVQALSMHAVFFRGEGYANAVPENAWKPFYYYQNLALDYLNKSAPITALDSGWYVKKIGFAKSLGWDPKQVNLLIDDALSKGADDDRIFYGVMDLLLPKWHGDADLLDTFISRAVRNAQAERGLELYARLYSAASQFQYQHELFNQSKASWPKMKKGFEDVLKRYPDPWNVNIYAHFSCLAKDKGKTKELMKAIGAKPILLLWEPAGDDVFESCKTWALSS